MSHMIYYVEIWKTEGENKSKVLGERRFEENRNQTRRFEKLKDEQQADGTIINRSTRKIYGDAIFFVGRRL